MTLLLAALLMAAQAPGPEREMLDALKASCSRAGNIEEMKADAKAAGWEPIADEAEPRIARLNKLGRDAVGKEGKLSGASFRRTAAGRPVFLILSRYEDESGYWGAGCRLYDFEATAPVDPAALEAWAGKPATAVETPVEGLTRRRWEPGWRSGLTVEATHVPAGHALGSAIGLQGNILVVQATGGS